MIPSISAGPEEFTRAVTQALLQEMEAFLAQYRRETGIETDWKTPLLGFADVDHPYIRSLRELISPHPLPTGGDPARGPDHPQLLRPLSGGHRPGQHRRRRPLPHLDPGVHGDQSDVPAHERPPSAGHRVLGLSRRLPGEHRLPGPGPYLQQLVSAPHRLCRRAGHLRHEQHAHHPGRLLRAFLLPGHRSARSAGGAQKRENCLYKREGKCGACIRRCPVGALSAERPFDRARCREQLCVHEAAYGERVCGKCTVGMPCTFQAP